MLVTYMIVHECTWNLISKAVSQFWYVEYIFVWQLCWMCNTKLYITYKHPFRVIQIVTCQQFGAGLAGLKMHWEMKEGIQVKIGIIS